MYLCIGLPRKKKRKLENKNTMLYQTIDLFNLVLDHVSLVGADVAKLIHQQLYHDTVLPLLTSLPSLVNIIGYFTWKPLCYLCCYSNHASYSVVYT